MPSAQSTKRHACETAAKRQMDAALKHHVVTVEGSVAQLECTEAFKLLTPKERLYAYHVGKAAWEGAKICLLQTSAESPAIFR